MIAAGLEVPLKSNMATSCLLTCRPIRKPETDHVWQWTKWRPVDQIKNFQNEKTKNMQLRYFVGQQNSVNSYPVK